MAQTQTKAKPQVEKQLTWQQKLAAGHPLTPLEEVKADADFNYNRRLRDEEEKAAFEKLKAHGRTTPEALAELDNAPAGDDNTDGEGK